MGEVGSWGDGDDGLRDLRYGDASGRHQVRALLIRSTGGGEGAAKCRASSVRARRARGDAGGIWLAAPAVGRQCGGGAGADRAHCGGDPVGGAAARVARPDLTPVCHACHLLSNSKPVRGHAQRRATSADTHPDRGFSPAHVWRRLRRHAYADTFPDRATPGAAPYAHVESAHPNPYFNGRALPMRYHRDGLLTVDAAHYTERERML
jgi:hypothetical protein